MALCGLTISNPMFGPIFWLALAYALASTVASQPHPQELMAKQTR
jgi:hypothetical protein